MVALINGGGIFSFTFLGRRLRFVWERDAMALKRVYHFVDTDHARQFLDALTSDERIWPMLRMLILDSPHLRGQNHLTREDLLTTLAGHLAHRTLLVVEGRARTRPGGGGIEPPDRPTPKPPPPIARATFIEIELVDQDGRPVPNERYRITLPDGTTRTGRLDKRAIARVDGIRPAGPCDITFPDIHEDEWNRR